MPMAYSRSIRRHRGHRDRVARGSPASAPRATTGRQIHERRAVEGAPRVRVGGSPAAAAAIDCRRTPVSVAEVTTSGRGRPARARTRPGVARRRASDAVRFIGSSSDRVGHWADLTTTPSGGLTGGARSGGTRRPGLCDAGGAPSIPNPYHDRSVLMAGFRPVRPRRATSSGRILGRMDDARLLETTIASRVIHTGRYLTVRVDTIRDADGGEHTRDVVDHPGAVADPGARRRLGAHGPSVPDAGRTGDAGDPARAPWNARRMAPSRTPRLAGPRELGEETGYAAATWRLLGRFFTAPGFATEYMHLYLATDLSPIEGYAGPDVDERLGLVRVPWRDAVDRAAAGRDRGRQDHRGAAAAGAHGRPRRGAHPGRSRRRCPGRASPRPTLPTGRRSAPAAPRDGTAARAPARTLAPGWSHLSESSSSRSQTVTSRASATPSASRSRCAAGSSAVSTGRSSVGDGELDERQLVVPAQQLAVRDAEGVVDGRRVVDPAQQRERRVEDERDPDVVAPRAVEQQVPAGDAVALARARSAAVQRRSVASTPGQRSTVRGAGVTPRRERSAPARSARPVRLAAVLVRLHAAAALDGLAT